MKKVLLILPFFCLVFTVVNGQTKDTLVGNDLLARKNSQDDNTRIFTVVQQMPAFPGGANEYIVKHLKYPEKERTAGIQGTVYVSFIVETDGTVSNVKVIKGVPNGPGLDAEAVRVVSSMKGWTIGMQNGHPVRVSYNIPVRFILN